MRIRSPRGRCLRTPSGTEVSSGKWASLGAAGLPGLSWNVVRSELRGSEAGARSFLFSCLLSLTPQLLAPSAGRASSQRLYILASKQ